MRKADLVCRIWILLIGTTEAIDLRTHLALKVESSSPEGIEECLLETFDLKNSNLKMDCISLCRKNPSCFLSCKAQSGQCSLYSAKVSQHWQGTGLSMGECVSYWAEKKDLAGEARYTASSVRFEEFLPEMAANGYGCPLSNTNMYHSKLHQNEWLLADLIYPKCIDEVMVQTRGVIKDYSNNFVSVEVRVGNGAGENGNFTANPLLMRFEGPAELGEVVLFHGKTSLTGRYVSIQITRIDRYLIIMEMKIIEC